MPRSRTALALDLLRERLAGYGHTHPVPIYVTYGAFGGLFSRATRERTVFRPTPRDKVIEVVERLMRKDTVTRIKIGGWIWER